ncbi:peroxidase 45-like [Carex rostrata]
MKGAQVILSTLLALIILSQNTSALKQNYYAKTCPNLEKLVRGAVQKKMAQTPIAAPATLRLFFHDCFVRGCDASLMIINANGDDEWIHPDDFSLKPSGFDTVMQAKAAVDSDPRCTNKVSCADILALAARDAVFLSGGPSWPVELGRYDGKISRKKLVFLPHPDFSFNILTTMFSRYNLSMTDFVALSGGHTIGAASCKFFSNRLYPTTDLGMDSKFENMLKGSCPINFNSSSFAFLDNTTPQKFDNEYFKNLQQGKGVLASDKVLFTKPITRRIINRFATNERAFFNAFTRAMTNLGRIQVKTAMHGEIRRDCRFHN